MTTAEFVRRIYPAARIVMRKNGLSAIFITAQAALESGWGRSIIGRNNIFGITRGSWQGPVVLVTTTEYFATPDVKLQPPEEVLSVEPSGTRWKYRVRRLFRDYATLEEALDDHSKILRGRGYADAWPYRSNPDEFVRRIQDDTGARYATSPEYVDVMTRLFRTVEQTVAKLGLDSPEA